MKKNRESRIENRKSKIEESSKNHHTEKISSEVVVFFRGSGRSEKTIKMRAGRSTLSRVGQGLLRRNTLPYDYKVIYALIEFWARSVGIIANLNGAYVPYMLCIITRRLQSDPFVSTTTTRLIAGGEYG
jgi:hypothetical protein